MNNKYYKRSHISEAKFRHLIKCFSLDLTATETAELTDISLRSVTVIFDKLRLQIARWCEQLTPIAGTVEVDESYFGPRRVPGKRGRGASGKTIVFGIFKRQGQVYTEIVPDARKKTLQRVIRGKVDPESVIHSDGWRGAARPGSTRSAWGWGAGQDAYVASSQPDRNTGDDRFLLVGSREILGDPTDYETYMGFDLGGFGSPVNLVAAELALQPIATGVALDGTFTFSPAASAWSEGGNSGSREPATTQSHSSRVQVPLAGEAEVAIGGPALQIAIELPDTASVWPTLRERDGGNDSDNNIKKDILVTLKSGDEPVPGRSIFVLPERIQGPGGHDHETGGDSPPQDSLGIFTHENQNYLGELTADTDENGEVELDYRSSRFSGELVLKAGVVVNSDTLFARDT